MRTKNRNTDRRTSAGVSTLIYRSPLLSTTQYDRKEREETSFPLSKYRQKHTLCVLYCTYLHTHKQTEGRTGSGWVRVIRLWAITGDTIWVTYSGEEKASKPTEGVKSLPPRMLSFQIRQLFFSSSQ